MSNKERILEIIGDFTGLPADEIDTSASLKTGADLDSFGMLTMMNRIEDEFGIQIPEDAMRNFRTVDDIIKYASV